MNRLSNHNTLLIERLDTMCYCSLFNYGKIKDYCNYFSYSFTNKVYGIIGSFRSGGWALTSTLSGKNYKKFNNKNELADYEGLIKFNNEIMNTEKLKRVSWYVNDLPLNIKLPFKKKTVKNYLERAKQLNPLSKESVEDIIRIFNIQRINHEIEATGYELLSISIAVGYLLGRKIFCFPWLNNTDINQSRDTLINIKKYLTENGCIILIPTDLKENLKGLADEFVEIKTSEQKWEIQKNIKKILYNWCPFGAKTKDIMETDIFSNTLMYITEYYVYRKLELGLYIYHTFINEYKIDFIKSKEDCLDLEKILLK